jgi:CubicO group peptidase (beta-lactamase class C family)
VSRFVHKPLDFQTGEKWSYSNSGYILLGYLIETISGESYQKFIQGNIFTPLGMKDSGYDSNIAIIPHRAAGYAPAAGYAATKSGLINAGFIDMSIPYSAGGLYSTTEDLLRWEQGFFGGKLLSPASLQKMTTPFKNNYAFGLQVHMVNGHKVIDHGGGIEGFNTMLAYYPEDKLTVVVLGNLSGQAPDNIALKLAAVAQGEKVVMISERKEITVNPKLFDGYVGRYQLAPSITTNVTQEDGHLFVRLTGQPKFEAFPEGERDYFLKVVDAQITFVIDSQGHATELILHQNGLDQHAKRVE